MHIYGSVSTNSSYEEKYFRQGRLENKKKYILFMKSSRTRAASGEL
jgi:hypothetical protein